MAFGAGGNSAIENEFHFHYTGSEELPSLQKLPKIAGIEAVRCD
jgi:hypothetical protein